MPLLLLLAGRVSLLVAAVVSTRVSTSLLGAAEMGLLNLLLGLVALPALLVSSFSQYFNRQAMEWRLEGRLGLNWQRYLRFLLLAGLLSAGGSAVALAQAPFAPARHPFAVAALVAGHVVLVSANGALLHLCNLGSRRAGYVLLSNLSSWGGLALAVAFSRAPGAGAMAWLGALLGAQGLSALLAARLLAANLASKATSARPKSADFDVANVWAFSWPLLVCCGLYWVQRSAALPWLAVHGDMAQLGHFSVAFSVGMLAMLSFDTLFKEAYAPLYYGATALAAPATRNAAWNLYARAFVPALGAAGLCVVAAGPALLRWLTADDFHPWTGYLAWGVASQWLISIYSLCVLEAATSLRNRSLIGPNLAGAVTTLLLLAWPLEADAGERAALATTGGLACTTLLAALDLARRPGLRWPWRRALLGALVATPAFGLAALPPLATGAAAGSLAALAAVAAFGAALQWSLGRWWLRAERAA